MTLTITPDTGTATLTIDYPPEEVVESAAARVRPLLLTDVDMFSVLRAITSLTASSADRELIRTWAARMRESWRSRTGEVTGSPGYLAMVESLETGEQATTDDRALALAWIYGDVVHHDPEHLDRTRQWNVGDRYRAAVPMVAYIMVTAIVVLENIRQLEARGHLSVSPEAWAIDVVAEPHYEPEATVNVAPVGAVPPTNASEPLGPEWRPLTVGPATGTEDGLPDGHKVQSHR